MASSTSIKMKELESNGLSKTNIEQVIEAMQ